MMKRKLLSTALVLTAIAFAAPAYAVTQSVTANIAFDNAITLTKNNDINFGLVKALTADTYTITTAGVVSAAGSGAAIGGTPQAGSITIAGSSSQTVNISVSGYTANNGVTPQNATCAYNGGAAGSCTISGAAAPGAGKTLLVGVQAVVSGAQAAGTTAAPTFNVNVVYN